MPVPDYQTLMLPVLGLAEQEVSTRDVVEAIAAQFALTREEREQLVPSGRQTTLSNRVNWAKTYLAKAGLVTSVSRGRFVASPLGREVLASTPGRIDVKYLSRFESFREFQQSRNSAEAAPAFVEAQIGGEAASLAPEETIRAARDEIEAALATELLDAVLAKSPAFFERLIVQLVVAMGYGGSLSDAGRALGRSGDGGVDGVIDEDALGLDRVYVQAKRYGRDNTVGPGSVRDFFGALDAFRANKGLFVTTSQFSNDAVRTANNLSKRIVLVDGARLASLMIRYDVGCRVIETIPIKKLDEDFFETD